MSAQCPDYPRKRPSSGHPLTSQKCQPRSAALAHSVTSSARASSHRGHGEAEHPCQALDTAPYGFGETRVATLALLTFTALSGWFSCGVVITKFPAHAVTFRSSPTVVADTPMSGSASTRILAGKPPRAMCSAGMLLGLYRIWAPSPFVQDFCAARAGIGPPKGDELPPIHSITSSARASSIGGTSSSCSLETFRSRHDHIGGVTPSRPTRHARPCSVPSGCLIAAMKTFAPGLRSLLSPCT